MLIEELSLPALMRAARSTYAVAIRAALADGGCDDLPRNGPYVLGALATGDAPLSDIIDALGLSKQSSGALVDQLVARHYVSRETDPSDRRRLVVRLTNRGTAASAIVTQAISRIDAELIERVGPRRVAQTRTTLIALARPA